MNKLFFGPAFKADFTWKGHEFQVGSVLPENKKQISESIKGMSSTTIRNRFLGSKKDFTEKELEYLTRLDGWNHYAIGLVERASPHHGVGLVRMVRSSTVPEEAEVAITLVDRYQKLGLGTFLMNLMVLAAMERDICRFSFTFLPDNEGIRKLIAKVAAPLMGQKTQDYVQEFIDFKTVSEDEIKARLVSTLPLIGTFQTKT